jgi:uncharacterized protein (TIGR00297 family)
MPFKAIPPARDRLQSRLLVWIGIPVLCYLTADMVRRMLPHSGRFLDALGQFDFALTEIILISLAFALVAWRLRAATPLAAVCGGMTCFLLTAFSHFHAGSSVVHTNLTPLLLLFVLTFQATRLGQAHKAAAGLAESRKGRNAAQVIANLGIAALFSSVWILSYIANWGRIGSWQGDNDGRWLGLFLLPTLAALAEAAADTVSSEIGQAFGGTPFLLTTLRCVPRGTDGAISLTGTLAGILAAAIITATGAPALGMSLAECSVAFAAGVCGLFFDSLLGATVERKGWIGNDLVNFFSTAFAAAVALLAIRFSQPYFLH